MFVFARLSQGLLQLQGVDDLADDKVTVVVSGGQSLGHHLGILFVVQLG